MNKYEILEDMKNNMLTLVGNAEVPTEVKDRLKNYCSKLKEITSKYNSNPESILEYIDMNLGYVENMLNRANDEKINTIASEIIHKCRNMEQKLEENEEENEEQNREEFKEIICGKNTNIATTIIEAACDYIKNVSNRAANILEQRGYSDYTINAQGNEINQFINIIKSLKSQENIFQELEKSDKGLLDKVMNEYENYKLSLENIDEKKHSSKEDSFRETLRNGVPDLEEQKNNSIQFLKEQEGKKDIQNADKDLMTLDDEVII